MKITFKLFASLAQYLPPGSARNIVELELAPGASVHDVLDAHHVPRTSAHLVLVNGLYVEPQARDRALLRDGDVLAVWPPVAGG